MGTCYFSEAASGRSRFETCPAPRVLSYDPAVLLGANHLQISELVRGERVHRAAYIDPHVFALEEERIFRRVWLYVAHESEVPAAGDYVLTRLGPEEVILARQENGTLSL